MNLSDYYVDGELEILGATTSVNWIRNLSGDKISIHMNSGDSILARVNSKMEIIRISKDGWKDICILPLKLKKIKRERTKGNNLSALEEMKIAFHVR